MCIYITQLALLLLRAGPPTHGGALTPTQELAARPGPTGAVPESHVWRVTPGPGAGPHPIMPGSDWIPAP
eukprot:765616-Hanusia_phi.AAC.4